MRTVKMLRLLTRSALAVLALLLMTGTSAALAKTIYVDTGGNDAFDGTSPTAQGGLVGPKATIGGALAVAASGDVISVEAGTYNESVTVATNTNLTFESRVAGADTDVAITGNLTNNVAGTTIGQGAGTFSVGGNLTLQSGSLTVVDGKVSLASGVTITRTTGTLSGQLNFPTGLIHVTYNGNVSTTAGPELPADLNGGDLSAAFTVANQVLTLGQQIEVDDVNVNGNSTIAGTLLLNGNAAGHADPTHNITGTGRLGTLIVSQTVSIDGAVTLTGALDIQNGGAVTLTDSPTVASVNLVTGSSLTLGANTLSVTGDFLRTGGTFNAATGTLAFTGTAVDAQFSPGPNFSIANITVNKSGRIVTFNQDATITGNFTVTAGTADLGAQTLTITGAGSIVTNNGTLQTTGGVLLFTAAGATLSGSGDFGNITVLTGGGDIVLGSSVDFTGILSLSNGGITTGAFDISPEGNNAMVSVNLAGTGTDINGSFNADNVRFDLQYLGALGGATAVVGSEFATASLRNLTISATNGTVDADAAPGGTIAGNVVITGVSAGNELTVNWPEANTTINGNLTVGGRTTLFTGAAHTLTLAGDNGAYQVAGLITGADTIVLQGANVTLTGSTETAVDAAEVPAVTIDGSATITDIQEINGNLTVGGGDAVTLALREESRITGMLIGNGNSITLNTNTTVTGGVDVNTGILAINGNLTATGGTVDVEGVADITGTGILILNGATNLDLNGNQIANVEVQQNVTFDTDTHITSSLRDNGAGQVTAADTVSVTGSFRTDGGVFVAGAGPVILNTTTVLMEADVTVNTPLEIANSASVVTLTSNDGNVDRTLTVGGNLTIDGTLELGDQDVVAAANVINRTGTVTAGDGLINVAGGDIEPDGTFVVPNLTTSGAQVDIGVTTNGTVRVTGQLVLNTNINENDNNDALVIGDQATIVVNAANTVVDAATFEGRPSVVYNAAMTTGNELPSNGQVQNLTANQAVTTDQNITVNGTLALNALITTGANMPIVLAEEATLLLDDPTQAPLPGATVITFPNTYNLTYRTGANATLNDAEYKNGKVGTLTADLGAGNVLSNSLSGQNERTARDLVVTTGQFDLAGNDFNIGRNLTQSVASAIINTGGVRNVSFTGDMNGTWSLNGEWDVPATINVEMAKSSNSTVNLTGGNLDLRQNLRMLLLNGGQLDTDNSVSVKLYQDASTQGFTQGNASSSVTGNVEKVLYAGNPLANIPAGEPGAGNPRASRFEFPVGAPNGEYRPAALVFRSDIPTRTDLTVRHETASPEGTLGFPLTSNGVVIGNYPDFYWLMTASTSLGQAQAFDVELTGTQIGLPFDDVDDLRIIRRFDGSATTNAWSVQGAAADYENFLAIDADGDSTAILRVTNSTGGLVPQGARFTLGIPVRAPSLAFEDTSGTFVELTDTTEFDVDEGDTLTVNLQYSSQDIGEPATLEVVSAPDFVTVTDGGDGTATLVANPQFDDAGSHSVTLQVTDDSDSKSVTFTINVADVNQPPVITGAPGDTVTVAFPAGVSFTLGATDVEGDTISFTLEDPDSTGATLTVTDTTATFEFVPALTQQNGDTLSFTINVSDGTTTVPVSFTVVVTAGQLVLGDVTLNGEVSAFDAATLLQHVTGAITLSETALTVADVSGDGTVSAFDAALILQFDVEIITCFPAEAGCAGAKTIAAATGQLGWGEVEAGVDGLGMYIPVSLSGDVSNVYSVELAATIDEELAEVVSVSGTRLPEGWEVSYAVSEGGELRIAMAGTSPLANAGEVARIAIRLVDENAQVSVTAQGQINENGVAFLGEIAAREIPTEFELGSNYPNPFNPTTTFSYSLPETGKVMIQIFDITGRRVRVLVNEEKEAGIYKVQWDGRNDAGAQVASGMYLYQIRSGSFVDAKKMMLVK